MSEDTKKRFFRKPSKKTVIIAAAAAVLAAAACFAVSRGLIDLPDVGGAKKVEFSQLKAEDIPKTIDTEVIPEYRELERALGCLVDGRVYVVVTRGEKPTAGYSAEIEEIRLEKGKDGDNMQVHALFREPGEDETVPQMITYPYAVAETELTALPKTIELLVKYEDD